jgi:MFS family permease
MTGGAAAYTALTFTVWEQTHSPKMQAVSLMFTFGVAGILGPFAGALGDRFDRRRVMIISEAVAAAFFAAMVFVDDPVWLIALAFGAAVAEQPFLSASSAAIPNLAHGDEDIAWAPVPPSDRRSAECSSPPSGGRRSSPSTRRRSSCRSCSR